MADKFEGFDVQIRDRVSELDRSNEASGIIQGKIIRWEMVDRDDGDGGSIYKTAFAGEDEEGRLVFLGADVPILCFNITPFSREPVLKDVNQGIVRGFIELSPDQFGPGTKYKIAINVRAEVVAPIRYLSRRDCKENLREETTPCVVSILTTQGGFGDGCLTDNTK
jgi:hypothetical protein